MTQNNLRAVGPAESKPDRIDTQTLVTFSGPTCSDGTFHMDVRGPFTAKTLNNIIKQLEIYKSFLDEDDKLAGAPISETEPSE